MLSRGNPTQARLLTTQVLDREEQDTYQLSLVGQDRGNPPLSSSVLITISLLDVNDNPPLFSQPSWSFNLAENINNALIMDFNVKWHQKHNNCWSFSSSFQVTDADLDNNTGFDFSLDPSVDGLFSLVDSSPYSVSLFLSHSLDREMRVSYSFFIAATDRGQPRLTGQTQVTISVVVSQPCYNLIGRARCPPALTLNCYCRTEMTTYQSSILPP